MDKIREYTFSEWLNEKKERYGEKPALTCDGETLTYLQLDHASRVCAQRFIQSGLKKGDKVVLWGMNSLSWIIAFLGITMGGGVAVLMNYGSGAGDVIALSKKVDASWALIGRNKVGANDPAAAVDTVRSAGVPEDHILFLDDFMEGIVSDPEPLDEEALGERLKAVAPRDTQLIIYTTGTTSEPKAVELSSASILADTLLSCELLKGEAVERTCDALPLFHSFGLYVTFFHLTNGEHVFYVPDLKPEEILDIIDRFDIQNLTSVGAIFSALSRLPDFEEKAVGRIKFGFVGGGFTTPTEMMRLEKTFEGSKLLIGYGQTECSPTITSNISADPLERRAVSLGRPLPGIDVRIWDEKEGFLPQGGIGEIVVKGPITTNGYYGLGPDEQPFDGDGWLHTGDLGWFDTDGLLIFSGRIKDIIIRKGENISPVEIEQAIMGYPDVREAKVFGAPHPIWGESVEACVVPAGETIDEEKLRAFLRGSLSSYKVPAHFFTWSAFPLNSNGKLDQRTLKSEMLRKLRMTNIANALSEGLRVLEVGTANRRYAIVPVCELAEEMASEIGFGGVRLKRIRLAVEEMLTERIDKAYDVNGEVRMEMILMPQWLRIRFTDAGRPFRLDAPDASVSAKIILANTDAYSSALSDGNLYGSNLDWQYEPDFDINTWLYDWKETGEI